MGTMLPRPYKSEASRKTWQIELTDHQGRYHRFSARTRNRATVLVICRKIEGLIDYRRRQEPTPPDLLQWAEACHPAIRKKLLAWGLVTAGDAHAGEPLEKHVEAWRQSLENEERTEHHAKQCESRIKRLFEESGFEFYADIAAEELMGTLRQWRRVGRAPTEGWSATRKRVPLSAQTCNHYLKAAKQFCAWMRRQKRAASNPLAEVKGYDQGVVNADRRHPRRALSLDEQRFLLATTAKQPARWKMSGSERGLLYRLVLSVGLRANECRSLTAASFHLAAAPATVTVRAADSKHREEDVLALPQDLVPLLKEHLGTKLPHVAAWPTLDRSGYGRMFREDLEAARLAWVDEAPTPGERNRRGRDPDFLTHQDAAGRYADYHSLRHSFISEGARAGIRPKVLQELSRHADIRTTMRFYVHVRLDERAAALDRMPSLDAEPNADRGAKRGAS